MLVWRNRQTRRSQTPLRNRMGSSPITNTRGGIASAVKNRSVPKTYASGFSFNKQQLNKSRVG